MSYDARTLRRDLAGGIATALVVLPLALAFGVVSGLGAAAGLYGAVAVGFFAAVSGGSLAVLAGILRLRRPGRCSGEGSSPLSGMHRVVVGPQQVAAGHVQVPVVEPGSN